LLEHRLLLLGRQRVEEQSETQRLEADDLFTAPRADRDIRSTPRSG
jgi:hypothetical protein